ncbi:TAXI family TRAP transporter solute-binding subunit [Calidifontibacillus oryziterrae]|uniref:TAXI family TRAP transporter solute-binding subunit n=1 Tax=Calidifontibacillus oryziterrae TaxID=1191699 RepID=UPI00030ECC74|nr:TAXI family TRAP transporter solute-binding subunit [Calidifontibacillus oryziterrae]
MNWKMIKKQFIVVLCILFLITGCGSQFDQPKYFNNIDDNKHATIATGGKYGPYFMIGSALAEIYSLERNMNASVQTTGGSVDNILLLNDGKAEIAFVMSDVALAAYEGQGNFSKKYKDLRVMAGLYTNYVQIVTLQRSNIHSVHDLVGKRVGVGAPNSGVEVNARMILKGYGLGDADYEPYMLSYHESMEKLKQGEIDAAFVTSGLPNSPVVELSKEEQLTIVPIYFTEMNMKELSSYFIETDIPADTYGNKEPVRTIGIQNLLLARKDLPEVYVFDLISTLYDNIEKLQSAHEAMLQVSPLDPAPNLSIPLHDGAKRYYETKK